MQRLLAALAFTVALATGAAAQTRWDLPAAEPESSFNARNLIDFAKDVENRTSGSLKITVHPGESLIRQDDVKDAVRRGVVPIGAVLSARLVRESPLYQVDTVPFLAVGYDAAWRLYQAQKPVLQKLLEREGLTLLFSVPRTPHGIFTKAPLTRIEDLGDVKLRTTAVTQRFAEAVHAQPVTVEAADLRAATADGRIEALIGGAQEGVDLHLGETLPTYNDVQMMLPRNLVLLSKSHFDALTDGEKRAVTDAAAAAETKGWEQSKAAVKQALEQLAASGVKVVAPADAVKQGGAAIGQLLGDEWAQAAGAEGKAILDAYRKK
jgi:TRAP-type C4-dicarboxylate transport system substrate-binding protein